MPSNTPIRIAIAGGGTGGHVLPAVSVIEQLRARGVEAKFLWIGSSDGIERQAAENLGIPFTAIKTGKLRRYLDLKTVTDSLKMPIGLVQALRAIRAFAPDVIFSTGGYVSVPSVAAGARLAPILTHEQTTIIGLATKLNARFADVLALSYEQTRARVGSTRARVVVTGNPVRASLATGNGAAAYSTYSLDPSVPLVYVTGGARGASPINQRIEALLPDLLNDCAVLHQAGPAGANDDAARLRRLRESWPAEIQARYHVTEFVRDELPDVFAAAQLVVARAGAGTVAELAYLGKPSLLIPLPLSGGGEQIINARVLADAGAAIVVPQDEATPERLRTEISALMRNPEQLARMASAAKSLASPDAAEKLADELLALARR